MFLADGYYSAVQHRDDKSLVMIRARAKDHAQRLLDFFEKDKCGGPAPEMKETPPPADYRWRITLTKIQWSNFVAFAALEINYDNFKNEAHKRKNPEGYCSALHKVWDEMMKVQDKLHPGSIDGYWHRYGAATWTSPKVSKKERKAQKKRDAAAGKKTVADFPKGTSVRHRLGGDEGEVNGSVGDQVSVLFSYIPTAGYNKGKPVSWQELVPPQNLVKVEDEPQQGTLSFTTVQPGDDTRDIEEISSEVLEEFETLEEFGQKWDGSYPEPQAGGFLRGR